MRRIPHMLHLLLILLVGATLPAAVGGDLRQWHQVNLTIAGPSSTQDATPNPFLDYRFNVTFRAPSGKTYLVPGYFAGDGTGGSSGSVWVAHLNPHETGTWTWTTSFRSGTDIAVSLDAAAGTTIAAHDGLTGSFTVAASNKSGLDFRAPDQGMLVNRGQHYLTYGGSGKPFIFTGPGIPENILGYRGFTNTTVGIGHVFDAHLQHWKAGDPDWDSGAGKRLIGALNYMADNGGNTLYLMSNTIGGDGKDCCPHPTVDATRTRYDLRKLMQWDLALSHAQRKGIYLHWVLAETEESNYTYYGGTANAGSLTTARKLYFRMMAARFGHYNALKWNLCEEIRWVAAERNAQASYLKAIDPYDHPVTYQAGGVGLAWSTFDEHLGDANYDALSFQGSLSRGAMFDKVKEYRDKSATSGVKWAVAWDEPQRIENDNTDAVNGYPMGRRDKMWPCLMAGGDGFLWYIQADGGGHGFDQRIEDFSIMLNSFRWSKHARDFLTPMPLLGMTPSRGIVTSTTGEDYALYQAGEVYAVFNDRAGTGMSLDLRAVPPASSFSVQWFDPRNGGALQNGTVTNVTGGGVRDIGSAPSDTGMDWAALIRRTGNAPANQMPTVNAGPDRSIALPAAAGLAGVADDDGLPSGSTLSVAWSTVSGPGTVTFTASSSASTTAAFSAAGTYVLRLSASDGQLSASDEVTVTAAAASGPFITHTLINADTDLPMPGFDPLLDGAVIDLALLPTGNLAVRAHVVATTGSVRMVLSGTQSRTQTENVAPYALHGDSSGNFTSWPPPLGGYSLTSTAWSASGATGTVLGAQTVSFSVVETSTPPGLPAGWVAGDIGSVTPAGSTTYANGTWTLAGSGADIWGSADTFHFARLPASGDVRLTVRVQSQTATHAWAKAGLMIRSDEASNARHASIFATPSNGVSFQRRTTIGGASAHTSGNTIQAPVWLRLERVGTTVTGWQSPDGVTWTKAAEVVNDLGTSPLVGLAVTSHLNGTLATAVFTDLSIIAMSAGNG